MEVFKVLGVDVGSKHDPVKFDISDISTGEIIGSYGLADGEMHEQYIPGMLTWIIKVYHNERCVFEENPYSIVGPIDVGPMSLMPICRVSASRKGQKVLINQIWNYHHPGQTRKRNHRKGTVVIRMGGIGDLVMLSSSLYHYKKKHPKTPLILATVPKHMFLFKGMPWIDEIIEISELQYNYFDTTIDLRWKAEPPQIGAGKTTWEDYTSKDRSDIFDELLGVYPSVKKFSFNVNKSIQKKFKSALASQLPYGKMIGLNAACHAPMRSIPVSYVKPICREIIKFPDTNVILFGKTETFNKELLNIHGDRIFNIIDKTDLEDMIVLISMLDSLITVDTGSLHIGGALGIKTLALFGNINPRTRVSYYPSVTTMYPHGELPCIPCFDVVNPCMDLKPIGSKCMRLLTPSRIAEKLEGWI